MPFEGDGPWDLPIAGFEVMHLTIGAHLVDLLAYGEDGVSSQIRLGGPFTFQAPSGASQLLDPGQPWEPLAALFALRLVAIRHASWTHDYTLRLEFASGHSIVCSQGPFEAWEIHLPDGGLIIAPPV
jgi:hypothetical protein